MPKNPTATVDELAEAKAACIAETAAAKSAVEGQVAAARKEAANQLNSVDARLKAEIQRVDNHSHATEAKLPGIGQVAKADTEKFGAALRIEIESLRPFIVDSVERSRAELDQQIRETDAVTRDAFAQELEQLCLRFDQELASVKASVEVYIEQRAAEAAAALQKEREEVDANLAQAQHEAATATEELQKFAGEELVGAVDMLQDADKKQDKRAREVQAENDERFQQLQAQAEANHEAAALALQQAQEAAAALLGEHVGSTIARFDGIDDHVSRLWATFNDIENVPTRKTEWVIKDAAKRIKLSPTPERESPKPFECFFSPCFDMAGARGMQIELRLFRPCDPPAEGEERGDCAVLLRAKKGTHIAFKLSMGTGAGAMAQTFERRFAGDEPVGFFRLCFFMDHVSSANGQLRLTVEVLESIYEFDRKVPLPEPEPVAEGEPPPEPPLDTFFVVQRHVNNRVLDMVRNQLEHFRNRCVRRVEWRLEQASTMRTGFARGAHICSKLFDAAGISGMQIVFYPHGAPGATEGYCSAFLSAPAGATLKGTLAAGKERREINHTFEQEGQFGKINFARLDAAMDEEGEDVILIALDIEEAHQDLIARLSHPPPENAGIRTFTSPAAPAKPFGSIVKLRRAAEALASPLQEVKLLPSLWAERNSHDRVAAAKLDGLRPLRDVRRRGASGARRSPSSPLLH